jgi:DNA-binding MarR family transcriptional regulator
MSTTVDGAVSGTAHESTAPHEAAAAQDALMRFVRNFGLHQPERTPCGQPLPVSEAHAMVELARDGSLRQVELARRLRLRKSTVSRLVTNLAGRGWLRRHAADDDGRGVLIELTEAGAVAAARQARARQARFAALLARVPDAERAAVTRALRMLAEAADEPW